MPKILIVEDEKILAEMFKDKFELKGFQIVLAFSSSQALEILKKEEKPDLILLDILLPRENGISFLRKMKEIKNTTSIPVVAFSNYEDPNAIKQAYQLGVKAYLIKTQFTPSQLVKEVKKYL